MTYLPDVNIWIALTSDGHVHHVRAADWLRSVGSAKLVFCRVSELGFLRLLTNSHVKRSDILSPAKAWAVYDRWRADDRVTFLTEEANFNQQWRSSANDIPAGPNARTDAYLAVFAAHANATVLTLDRNFFSLSGAAVQCLK